MKTNPTFENRIEDIITGIHNLRQEMYVVSCEVVSDDTLRPDTRVDRVVKLDGIISSLGQIAMKLNKI
jgi:hypothetical protein